MKLWFDELGMNSW